MKKKILLCMLLLITIISAGEFRKAEATHHFLCTCYGEFADVKNTRFDYYIDDTSIMTDDSFVSAQIIMVVERNVYTQSSKAYFYNLADGKGWFYNNERSVNGGWPVTYDDFSGHAMDFILKYYNN